MGGGPKVRRTIAAFLIFSSFGSGQIARAYAASNPVEVTADSSEGGSLAPTDPHVIAILNGMVQLTRELILPTDSGSKIHIQLVDNPTTQIRLEKRSDGDRNLVVDSGVFLAVRNDEELAYLLAEALERPTIDLQARIDRLSAEAKAKNDPELYGLKETALVEASVRAVSARLVPAGFNPHSAFELAERLSIQEKDEGTKSWASRRDAISSSLTHLTRVQGRNQNHRFADQPRKNVWVKPFEDSFVSKPGFTEVRRKKVEDLLRNPQARALQAYQEAQKTKPDLSKQQFDDVYAQDFVRAWTPIAELSLDFIRDPKAVLDTQLRLHQRLCERYEEARQQAGIDRFKPRSVAQVEALILVEERRFPTIAPPPFVAANSERNGQRNFGQDDSYYQQLRKDYELAKHAFEETEPGELDRLLNRYDDRSLSLGNEPGTLMERGLRPKMIADDISRSGNRIERLQASIFPLRLKSVRSLKDFDKKVIDPAAEAGVPVQVYGDILNKYIKLMKTDRSKGKFDSKNLRTGSDYLFQMNDGRSMTLSSMLGTYKSYYPEEGADIQKRLLLTLFGRINTLNELRVFGTELNLKSRGYGGLASSLQDPEVFKKVLEKSTDIFKKTLGDAQSPTEVLEITGAYGRERAVREKWGVRDSHLAPLKNITADSVAIHAAVSRLHDLIENSGHGPSPENELLERLIEVHFPFLAGIPRSDFERLTPGAESLVRLKQFPKTLAYLRGTIDITALDRAFPAGPSGAFDRLAAALAPTLRLPESTKYTHPVGSLVAKIVEVHPEEARLIAQIAQSTEISWETTKPEDIPEAATHRYSEQLRSLVQQFGPEEASYRFWSRFPKDIFSQHSLWIDEIIRRVEPTSLQSKLDFMFHFVAGSRRAVVEGLSSRLNPKIEKAYVDSLVQNRSNWPDFEKLATAPETSYKDVSLDTLTRGFKVLVDLGTLKPGKDRLIEEILHRVESSPRKITPELRDFLLEPGRISQIHFDDNRLRLAKLQLELRFHLNSNPRPSAKKNEIRPEIPKILEHIKTEFPSPSYMRDQVLAYAEKKLTTTPAEETLVRDLRLGRANWTDADGIPAVTAIQTANQFFYENRQRLDLVRYLIGSTDRPPVEEDSMQIVSHDDFEAMRRNFSEASGAARIHGLMPLLDRNDGILSEPALTNELFSDILGPHRNPLVETLFKTYIEVLPESESKVFLGHLLGQMAERRGSSASLKMILEAMGPFGIKAGQFLRTSGILPPEMRAELDDFFDHALEPDRGQVMDRLREVFGKNLVHVESVGPIAGSGSLNTVVVADIIDPATGKARRMVVRMARPEVGGTIANENRVWERVAARLKTHSDPQIVRMAYLIDEARAHAWESLKPGGVELDLSKEVDAYELAQKVYERGVDSKTGFHSEVTKPVDSVMGLIPAELKSQFAVYEHVPNTRYKDIAASPFKQALAEQIAGIELDALFKGKLRYYDRDGHRGNWLIDLEGRRLVRTDYPLIRQISETERDTLKTTLLALLRPESDGRMVDLLTNQFPLFFEPSEVMPTEKLKQAIRSAVSTPDFPKREQLQERLFRIQAEVEKQLRLEGQPHLTIGIREPMRAALMSLGAVSGYAEDIGAERFGRLLFESLDGDRIQYAALSAKEQAKRRLQEIRRCLSWNLF